MRIDDDRIVPFRRTKSQRVGTVRQASQTVQVDIEIDLIRQCREDWRRGETEVWRHVSLEAEFRRDAEGRLCLHGLPGYDNGILVPPAHGQDGVMMFEEPGLCVAISNMAIRQAEMVLREARIVPMRLRRAG